MEALEHNKPHKRQTYAEHCKKAFVLGTSTEHYQCWKFWSTATQATWISVAVFFRHKYLTNLPVIPKDLVVSAAENLAWALKTSIPQHLSNSMIQALKGLLEVFTDVALNTTTTLPCTYFAQCPPYASPSGANSISKGTSHSPMHTTAKGAPHYDFSKGARHTTYSLTLRSPKKSIFPGLVRWGSMTENWRSANILPDQATWTILLSQNTQLVPTNNWSGHPGWQGRPTGWSCAQHPQSGPGPNAYSGGHASLYLHLWWGDGLPNHGPPHSTTRVPHQHAQRCPRSSTKPQANSWKWASTGEPQVQGTVGQIRAPLGARAYPWILSKYFLCVRPSVRVSVHVSVPLQISVGCVYLV